jgi:hypothetical protein
MTSRRSFVTALTSLAGFAVAGRSVEPLEAQAPAAPATPAARPAIEWDLSWMDQFKGKHKQVFDLHSFDLSKDSPLRQPTNYFDTFHDVYRLEPPDVNVAIGISNTALPMNMSDAIWEKYGLGERSRINDPATGKPATRNIYLGPVSGASGPMVRALQAKGAVFWQCNVALTNFANRLARDLGTPAADVRAELIAGFNPGVKLVPAHVMALGLVQERGFTYEKV